MGCYNHRIPLTFDSHLGSTATNVPAKFQSDWKNLYPNFPASRLQMIKQMIKRLNELRKCCVMLCCVVVWCGVVWCGVVWFGVWCRVVWCSVWCCVGFCVSWCKRVFNLLKTDFLRRSGWNPGPTTGTNFLSITRLLLYFFNIVLKYSHFALNSQFLFVIAAKPFPANTNVKYECFRCAFQTWLLCWWIDQ